MNTACCRGARPRKVIWAPLLGKLLNKQCQLESKQEGHTLHPAPSPVQRLRAAYWVQKCMLGGLACASTND